MISDLMNVRNAPLPLAIFSRRPRNKAKFANHYDFFRIFALINSHDFRFGRSSFVSSASRARTSQDEPGRSKTIKDDQRRSKTIKDDQRRSKTIKDDRRQSKTITVCSYENVSTNCLDDRRRQHSKQIKTTRRTTSVFHFREQEAKGSKQGQVRCRQQREREREALFIHSQSITSKEPVSAFFHVW
jgi:hypothetical protein